MTRRSTQRTLLGSLLLATCAACGGQGAGDATPIPSTGVPVAAIEARGVDVESAAGAPPTTPQSVPGLPLPPFPTAPFPTAPTSPDPFAPPVVSPPPVPPAPTSTGVPL